jgi:hypothetical protein
MDAATEVVLRFAADGLCRANYRQRVNPGDDGGIFMDQRFDVEDAHSDEVARAFRDDVVLDLFLLLGLGNVPT